MRRQRLIVDGRDVVVRGRWLRIARLKDEWDEDVTDPAKLVAELRRSGAQANIFTFAQRLPDCRPRYDYPMEWDSAAAIPISTYDNWLQNQLHQNHRNKVNLARKKGVVVRVESLSEDLVRRLKSIYDETPVRQGRRFADYKKDYGTLKREISTYAERAEFVTAYYGDELIGFIKLVYTGRCARTMGILAKVAHRDKAVTNVLIAEAVRRCAEREVLFLLYDKYTYGYGKLGRRSLREFKYYNGFESLLVPRYVVALDRVGDVAFRLGAHRGWVGITPGWLVSWLLSLRELLVRLRWGTRDT